MDEKKEKPARDARVDEAFRQLDAALCLWSCARGEPRQKAYFQEVIPCTRILTLGAAEFVITLAVPAADDVAT